MIDRDVVITLRRAWKKMGMVEKWRILNAILWEEDDEEVSIDEILGDSDLLSSMMEEAREVAPRAGEVLIDERIHSWLAGYSRFGGREGSGSDWSRASQWSCPEPRRACV